MAIAAVAMLALIAFFDVRRQRRARGGAEQLDVHEAHVRDELAARRARRAAGGGREVHDDGPRAA